MFTKISPKTDSQLSNENIVNLIVDDAITKISQLTGMTSKEAFALLVTEINQQTKPETKIKANTYQQAILEQTECKFILGLFN
jgi:uncharacterized protein YoaH (UPF0181 family)